jgi:hypothetical protein
LKAAGPVPPRRCASGSWRLAVARRPRWVLAAALPVAAAAGFVIGAFALPRRVDVRTIRVEVEKQPQAEEADTRRQLSVIGYALRGLYGAAVDVRFEGNKVTHIQANQELEKKHPSCPVLKEARRFSVPASGSPQLALAGGFRKGRGDLISCLHDTRPRPDESAAWGPGRPGDPHR